MPGVTFHVYMFEIKPKQRVLYFLFVLFFSMLHICMYYTDTVCLLFNFFFLGVGSFMFFELSYFQSPTFLIGSGNKTPFY